MIDEKNYSPFYRRYVELCKEHGFSVHGAVKAAGISSGSPTAWKGGAIPRQDQREKLCALFGVSDQYLLGYENEEPAILQDSGLHVETAYDLLTPQNKEKIRIQIVSLLKQQSDS